MTEIINLRRFKKQQARTEKAKEAEANRRAHGRTKAEKEQSQGLKNIAERHLDGHKRGPDGED
jgi:hypothetical protein